MHRLAASIMFGVLAGLHCGHAQPNPRPSDARGPEDRRITGEFTPDRVNSDYEADAKKAQAAGQLPFARGRRFYFSWSTMTPAEFEGLGRHVVFLISVRTRKPEDLPVERTYLRFGTGARPIYKVTSWTTPVDAGSVAAKMYGSNREDGFYLVPGDAMLRQGQILMDLSGGRSEWVILELPSNVASADAKHFPNVDALPDARPDLNVLQNFIRRKFPGFPVPQSLP